jgi:hypothetical protein
LPRRRAEWATYSLSGGGVPELDRAVCGRASEKRPSGENAMLIVTFSASLEEA